MFVGQMVVPLFGSFLLKKYLFNKYYPQSISDFGIDIFKMQVVAGKKIRRYCFVILGGNLYVKYMDKVMWNKIPKDERNEFELSSTLGRKRRSYIKHPVREPVGELIGAPNTTPFHHNKMVHTFMSIIVA